MDTHTSGMTYARFFPSDWRSGCFVLNLEEEGLYIRCCAYMYDTGRSIPADNHEAARLLNVQYNKYCKVMGSLVDKGKMIRGQGWIINERVQEELHKYRMEKFARSQAAKAREEARKKQAQLKAEFEKRKAENETAPPQYTPHHTPHQTGGVYPGVTPSVPTQSPPQYASEKDNEIKVAATTAVPPADHGSGTNPEARSQKPERKKEDGAVAPPAPSDALEAYELYNELALKVGIPVASKLTPQRSKAIMARLREHGGMDAWKAALAQVERSAFLQGRNDKGWVANLDFLTQATRFTKVVEGTYGNGAHADKGQKSQMDRFREYAEEAAEFAGDKR